MTSPTERLVYMANQIARNFEIRGPAAAAAATADHIASFWDPRMKQGILDHLSANQGGLSAIAHAAILSMVPPLRPK